MPRVQVGQLNVHYQQSGNGPDVVLMHAFTSNLAVWMLTNITGILAERFRVTMYDFRGHGVTSATANGYTSAQLAQDFFDLHTHLDLDPALIVGHSFGGVVGIHAAVEFPNLVRAVIVADTYFPGLAHLEPAMPHSEPWLDLRSALAKSGIQLSETVDFSQLFGIVSTLTDEQRLQLQATLGMAGARWLSQMGQLAGTSAGVEAFEVAGLTESAIRGVKQPVVALYDEHTPFAATRDFLQQSLSNCVVDTVPLAKHLAPVENSQEFVARVNRHLCRLANLDVTA